MLSYVQQNEETSLVKVVHCYIRTEDIPSELEPNCKIIDEAFPAITVVSLSYQIEAPLM